MKEDNFYGMISRMKYINRWGLMRNTINENIAEHSLDVAVIAHGLATIANVYFGKDINSDRVAILAMFHDSTEIITGDMPTPVKYFAQGIREAYKEVEAYAGEQLIGTLPEAMGKVYRDILHENENEKELWRYVKAADKISALVKCIEELGMGNTDFADAKIETEKAIKDLKMEEADYFMEKFLPSYSLTLDKQSE